MRPADGVFLARFPKTRPELPAAYRAIYDEHYRRNREGRTPATALSRMMESWMHRMVAIDAASSGNTLEIGAGNLNHLPYEPTSTAYDVAEPLTELCLTSPLRGRVRNVYGALEEITDAHYDRIISIASFEHYCNLPAVVAKCGLLLAPGGRLRIAIPSEGTILWKMGWKFTTGIEFRLRHRLAYDVLMRHVHVNTANETAQVLQTFFKDSQRRFRGILPSLSFYQFFECRNPDRELCRRYLESRSPILD